MKRSVLILTTLSLVAWLTIPTGAQSGDLLETLLENGAITQQQYEELRRQQQDNYNIPGPGLPAPATGQNVIVNTSGGLGGRSADGAFTFRLRGRVQVDGAAYDGGAVGDDGDKEQPGNGTEIRRARLSVEGRVWNDWEYELEMDFGEDDPELVDAFIRYLGYDPWSFRVGHIKEPFSLEEQITNLDITFMERALPNVFAPDRSIGIDAHTYGNHWTFATGLYGEGANDKDALDEGFAATARGTFAPILEETRVLHLGGSLTYRNTGDVEDGEELRLRARPESHISDIRYANTGRIPDVDDFFSYGVEAATVLGPFSVQAEYIATSLNREAGFADLDFDGYYIYGSWMLTGESRSYRDRRGEFGGITPKSIVGKGGTGAWELGVRYSHLDLTDGVIKGGEESNVTVGVNWYATPNIRFMFNYIHVDTKSNDNRVIEDPDIFQARAQLRF